MEQRTLGLDVDLDKALREIAEAHPERVQLRETTPLRRRFIDRHVEQAVLADAWDS